MIWSVKCSFVINLVLVFKQYVKTMHLSKFSIELILLVKPFFFLKLSFLDISVPSMKKFHKIFSNISYHALYNIFYVSFLFLDIDEDFVLHHRENSFYRWIGIDRRTGRKNRCADRRYIGTEDSINRNLLVYFPLAILLLRRGPKVRQWYKRVMDFVDRIK